ncbi:MAG: hypothetical protein HFG20_06275 [Anaerotruncus sp.]|nr:hypothetical protein [Anaerotruncus sp.]
MTQQQNVYYSFLEEYARFLEDCAQQEAKKYHALISYQPQEVDRAISSLQAALMRVDQMEKQRELLQEQAGYKGMTFQQILAQADAQDAQKASALFERFQNAVNDIRFMNSKSLEFAQTNIRELDGVLPKEKGITTSYAPGKMGAASTGSPLFETKI